MAERRLDRVRTTVSALAQAMTIAILARLLIAFVGVGCVVVGAIIAWKVRSATPLLVIGGVLAVLGVFKWRRIGISHGDTQVSLTLQDFAQEAAEAAESTASAAAKPGVPKEVREELKETAQMLEQASTAASSASVASSILNLDDAAVPRPAAVASHRKIGGGGVLLRLSPGGAFGMRYRCRIKTPDDRELTAPARSPGKGGGLTSLLGVYGPVEVLFPDDFSLEQVKPGLYRVGWEAENLIFTLIPRHLVARDSFRIERPKPD